MCSPYTFYQFWLNTADADVIDRLKVFTFLTRAEIEEMATEVAERPHQRKAQRTLAWLVTSLVHGEDATEKVIAASAAVFGNGELGEIDLPTLQAVIAELPSAKIKADELGILNVLQTSGLSKSQSEARRTVGEGGAYVNNRKVQGIDSELSVDDFLHQRYAIIRRGKKNMAVLELEG